MGCRLNKGLQLAIKNGAGESAKLWVKCEDCCLQMNSARLSSVSK
jgi:hypothetical protein